MSSNIRVARICNYCQKEFVAKTTVTKYCSHKCSSRAHKLRARVEKVEASRVEMVKVKSAPVVDLTGREFLTVRQAAQLLSSSPKAIYNMVESGRLVSIRLSARKTLIRRAEIDAFFDAREPLIDMRPLLQQRKFSLSDAYHMAEVQEKYGVSEKALYDLIKRFEIPKVAKGWYVYVPKRDIDILFNLKSS